MGSLNRDPSGGMPPGPIRGWPSLDRLSLGDSLGGPGGPRRLRSGPLPGALGLGRLSMGPGPDRFGGPLSCLEGPPDDVMKL